MFLRMWIVNFCSVKKGWICLGYLYGWICSTNNDGLCKIQRTYYLQYKQIFLGSSMSILPQLKLINTLLLNLVVLRYHYNNMKAIFLSVKRSKWVLLHEWLWYHLTIRWLYLSKSFTFHNPFIKYPRLLQFSFIKPVILLGFQLYELCACITPFSPIFGRLWSVVSFSAVGTGRW